MWKSYFEGIFQGPRRTFLKFQALVVRKVDNAIQRINHYPTGSVVCFVNTYPLDSDFSGGESFPAFEQLRPGVLR